MTLLCHRSCLRRTASPWAHPKGTSQGHHCRMLASAHWTPTVMLGAPDSTPTALPLWIIFTCPWEHNPFFQDAKSLTDLNWVGSTAWEVREGEADLRTCSPVPTGPPPPPWGFPNVESVFPRCANTHWQSLLGGVPSLEPFLSKADAEINNMQMPWETPAWHSVLVPTLVPRIHLQRQYLEECWWWW